MIRVLIPLDKEFETYKKECKTLYEENQTKICDPSSFEYITQNTFFYMFLNDNILIGAIYCFIDDDGKLFLNGFAKPKMHNLNIKCLNLISSWFSDDIYAEAQNRASALCLIRCGYERVKDNLFKKNYKPEK